MSKVHVILGPAPCQGCRALVVYGYVGKPSTQALRHWRDPATGAIHHCGAIPEPRTREPWWAGRRDRDQLTGAYNPERARRDPLTGEWH